MVSNTSQTCSFMHLKIYLDKVFLNNSDIQVLGLCSLLAVLMLQLWGGV